MVGSQEVVALVALVLTEAVAEKKAEVVEGARPILGVEEAVVAPCRIPLNR